MLCSPTLAATQSIGGNTRGLADNTSVTLRLNGAQDLVVTGNRSFRFGNPLAQGASFHVSVARPAAYRRCTVSGGDGTVPAAPVSTVTVDCTAPALPATDGEVHASVLSEDGATLFIGGRFDHVGQPLGGFARLDPNSGAAAPPWSEVSGVVRTVIPDGAGGWYLGGSITRIEGLARTGVVHVLPNGSLDTAFDAPANGPVTALLLHGGRLYVGGSFSQIGGQTHAGLAALSPSTGRALAAWAPQPTGEVYSLAAEGQVLYVAGDFLRIGGANRRGIAALDVTTGGATAWDPAPAAADTVDIRSVAVGNGKVFVGGRFDQIGQRLRRNIAALSPSTAEASAWNPGCSDTVGQVLLDGTRLYLRPTGGTGFACGVGGSAGAMAVLSTTGADAVAFQAAPNGDVRQMALDAGVLYLAGDFSQAGGATRAGFAALDAGTGLARPMNTSLGARVFAVAAAGGRLAVGGVLLGRQVARPGLAAISLANGAVRAWNPSPAYDPGQADPHAAWVSSLLRVGSTLYVGGNFNRIGTSVREGLAAFDTGSGALLGFDASLGLVDAYALSISGNRLFVGAPDALHVVEATSGQWQATLASDGPVRALRTVAGRLYLGGSFSQLAGQPRAGAAALDSSTLALTDWNPSLSRLGGARPAVHSLVALSDRVYLGGAFDAAGDHLRANLALVDTSLGAILPWNPGLGGSGRTAYALRLSGSVLYVGGSFTQVGRVTRVHLAAVDATTGQATPWAPRPNNRVQNLLVTADGVLAGGSFETIDGRATKGLAWIPR